MFQMTPAQTRVLDPILTELARGYGRPKAGVANALFPVIDVVSRGGRIIKFGADNFKLLSTLRAPGSDIPSIQTSYGSENYTLNDYALSAKVPVELMEEAAAVPGIDLALQNIITLLDIMDLERERAAALVARSFAQGTEHVETFTNIKQWSDAQSDPFTDIDKARELIRSKIGQYPTTLVVAPKVITALRRHTKVLDRLSTAADRPPATLAQLSALFEIPQIVVGEATYHMNGKFQDVWGTDAVLAFTPPADSQAMGSMSFGYTYQLKGYRQVEEGYYDRSCRSWVYPVSDANQVVLAAPLAGFLFRDAVAA